MYSHRGLGQAEITFQKWAKLKTENQQVKKEALSLYFRPLDCPRFPVFG